MIRAVIFDFGNVLCFPPSADKVARAAAFCGMSEDEFWPAFWNERLDYDAGKLEPLRYWTGVIGAERAAANLQELVRLEIEFWNHFDERPFQWIDTLRSAGIKVGMLSNLPRVLAEELKRTEYRGRPFLSHFDHATLSCELLCVKPLAPIYEHSCAGLNVAPGEALFIDDKLPNVHGAREVGLKAEHFTTWEEFLERRVPALHGLPAASK